MSIKKINVFLLYFFGRCLKGVDIMKKKLTYLPAVLAVVYVGFVGLSAEIDPAGWCWIAGFFCP